MRFIATAGVVLSALPGLAIAVLAVQLFLLGVPFAGFGTIICLMRLLCMFFSMVGVVGEYVGLVYEGVKQRANYVGRDRGDF